ncbi:polymer-forming cytoskeletal protein [Echinicola jeungdonensis]|uniref:Polymer-forming cytoskeletal protein n=1 Tax=Echinicola jeungdonensis TaxID=709343 RepID=A0ABV5J2I9_9BACT|nr:polymer-forming cytoskeletal protein [Echinicola jeungdonensis]MDN3668573.1 polymer-forming cytoskeletal protein [Echinicola jeungdonensis]
MFNKTEEKKAAVEMVNSSNVIAKETTIKGDIITYGNIRIEGTVEGTLSSKTKIVIGDSAFLKGNIDSKEAEIAGKIVGEVRCTEILFLKKTAVIEGNIYSKRLVIENGAVFNGECKMAENKNQSDNPEDTKKPEKGKGQNNEKEKSGASQGKEILTG